LAAAGLAGLVLIAGNGFEGRFPPEIREIANGLQYPSEWRIHQCLLELPIETAYAEECIERSGRPLVVVWGDSNAAALTPGLRSLQATENFDFAQLTASQCEPLVAFDVPGSPLCRKDNEDVLSQIEDLRPQVVILHGSGSSYPASIPGWERTIRSLKRLGIPKIVVLSPVPIWRRKLPDQFVSYFAKHRQMLPERSSDLVFRKWDEVDMRERVEGLAAKFISGWDAFCDGRGCLTKTGPEAKDLTASDVQHLTAAGSVYLATSIRTDLMSLKGEASAVHEGK